MEITDRIRSWLQNSQRRRRVLRTTLLRDEVSITLVAHSAEGEVRTELRWDEVDVAYGFKRDGLIADEICVVVGNGQRDAWIEVREGDDGFKSFLETLPEKLKGFPAESEWLQKVALPPFEARWTVLYRKVG